MTELKVDTVPQVVADVVEGHAEGGRTFAVVTGEVFKGLLGVVAEVDEVPVFFGEAIETGAEGFVAGFGFIRGEVLGGVGEGLGEFVAEDELVARSDFAPVFEDGEAGDGEGPGGEVGAGAEVGPFFPEREIGLLQGIIDARESGHARDDVGLERRLVPGEELHEFVVLIVGGHGWRLVQLE